MRPPCTADMLAPDFVVTPGGGAFSAAAPTRVLTADPQRVYLMLSSGGTNSVSVWFNGGPDFVDVGDGILIPFGSQIIELWFAKCGPLVGLEIWATSNGLAAELWWVTVSYRPRANNPPGPTL